MRKFVIDFCGSCDFEANNAEEAESKFWNDLPKEYQNYCWHIDSIEEVETPITISYERLESIVDKIVKSSCSIACPHAGDCCPVRANGTDEECRQAVIDWLSL